MGENGEMKNDEAREHESESRIKRSEESMHSKEKRAGKGCVWIRPFQLQFLRLLYTSFLLLEGQELKGSNVIIFCIVNMFRLHKNSKF